MPNFMLLATAWGPKHGGINAFNMDFACGLAAHLGESGKVFCAAFRPSLEDCEKAKEGQVSLVSIDRPVDSPAYDKSWAYDVWQELQKMHPNECIDWWIGHDVTTGLAAIEGPIVAEHGHSALIMHMNYADYQAYKDGVGERAVKKERQQSKLFKKGDRHFAIGPLLRDALKDIVRSDVTMLVPGFAEVPVQPSSHRLTLITFGRMDRESDRIKQGGLAVAGFASAVHDAWEHAGSPPKLKKAPQMRVIGIEEPGGDEEHSLKALANEKAGRKVNLIARPFDENRQALFDELGKANISLMLSWHEGFGLTGWEAVAGEVPLIVSRQSGLWQLLKETFDETLAEAYVRTIDVGGQDGDDDTANFRPADEAAVRDAILDWAADIESARQNAKKLKHELREKLVCSWKHTAKEFCDALGPERAAETQRGSTEPPLPTKPTLQTGSQSDFIAIPQPSWPENLGVEMPDSMMLRPESRVVRFHPLREPLRDEIIGWAIDPDQPIKLRLQVGEGGAGKTRLMIEVCEKLEGSHGWRAGFLARYRQVDSAFLALLRERKPCLVVLDYAESRTKEIITLTKTALHFVDRPSVRLVLLAREGGDWWDRLGEAADSDLATSAILRGVDTKTGPYRMTKERIEEGDRPTIFREALDDFAKRQKIAAPQIGVPDLSAEFFGKPLFIHLVALSVLRDRVSVDDHELLAAALAHERSYWRRLLTSGGMTEQMLPALEQTIAFLTLTGGMRSAREAKSLLARTPRLRELNSAMRISLFDLLRQLYRLEGGWPAWSRICWERPSSVKRSPWTTSCWTRLWANTAAKRKPAKR